MKRCNLPIWLLTLAVGSFNALPVWAESDVVLTMLDGETNPASLLELSTKQAVVSLGGKETSIPFEKLLRIDFSNGSTASIDSQQHMQLEDGSLLPVENVTVTNRLATVASLMFDKPLEIAAAEISLVYLRPPLSAATNFVRNLQEQPGDTVIVQKGDPPQFDHLTGILGDIDEESVKFNWDGEQLVVKRSKLAAVLYYHADSEDVSEARCWVKTVGGARLNAKSVRFDRQAQQVAVTLQSGLELRVALNDISAIDLSAGKLVYLSDLQPIRQEWTPLVGLPKAGSLVGFGLPRRDQAYSGSMLSLWWPADEAEAGETRQYSKGLALRSRSEVEYRIPQGGKVFQAVAGIDPLTADQGHVRLEIAAEKSVLWEGEIHGKQGPVDIELALPSARRLRFTVDYGENLDYGDRLHLVEARITK